MVFSRARARETICRASGAHPFSWSWSIINFPCPVCFDWAPPPPHPSSCCIWHPVSTLRSSPGRANYHMPGLDRSACSCPGSTILLERAYPKAVRHPENSGTAVLMQRLPLYQSRPMWRTGNPSPGRCGGSASPPMTQSEIMNNTLNQTV